ncbi:MAG TPA: hypothetical protein DCR35_21575, partial [Runella sp.]|nr:hypothetical protein [Runella sp.]
PSLKAWGLRRLIVFCVKCTTRLSEKHFNNNAKFGKVLETTQQFTKKAPIDVTRRALLQVRR